METPSTRRRDRSPPRGLALASRAARVAAAASLLGLTAGAPAAEPPAPRLFGVQLEAGVPAGGTLTAVVRPWPLLRLDAGVGYDVLAFGLVGGATVVPWDGSARVTFGIKAGHYFSADASRLASSSSAALNTLLADLSSTFLSGDVGLELGSPERTVFFVRAGLAWIWASAANLELALRQANPGQNIAVGPYSASARIPTLRVGVVFMAF